MKPNDTFLKLPNFFWAGVRLISQEVGYTEKGTGQIKIPSTEQINIKRLSGIWWGRRVVGSRIWQKRERRNARATTDQAAEPAQSGSRPV